jgi:hypothetical protein
MSGETSCSQKGRQEKTKMLNLKNKKMRGAVLTAFCAVTLALGATAARAQVNCARVQAHPAGDIVTVPGPFGWRQVVVPCIHWITLCD